MEETKINFRTKMWVKKEFFRICKEENINASARFNEFMRKVIKDTNSEALKNEKCSNDSWRDDLVRG